MIRRGTHSRHIAHSNRMEQSHTSAFIFIAASTISAAVISLTSGKKKGTKSKVAGVVSELVIYPIKGIPGLRIERATCTEIGLRYRNVTDRQFMIMSNNDYLQLKKDINLIHIIPKYDIDNDCLIISAPGMADLTVSLQPPKYDPSSVQTVIWYDKREVSFMEVDKECSHWFTKFLGKDTQLVTMVPGVQRKINPNFTYNNPKARHSESKIAFPNSHPYLLIHESSLDEVSGRVSEEIDNRTFRGNVVISQSNKREQLPAYDEDKWGEVSIGSQVVLFIERPCPRCPNINVDHRSKETRANKEPTTSLLMYRRGERGRDKFVPMFGAHASLITGGSMAVGDVITVTYRDS